MIKYVLEKIDYKTEFMKQVAPLLEIPHLSILLPIKSNECSFAEFTIDYSDFVLFLIVSYYY